MTLVLVEGPSDAVAVETLARLRGTDLMAADVRIASMDGITNLGRFLIESPDQPTLLMYDADETAFVERTVERTVAAVRRYVCDADLEDELIRALGVTAALTVVEKAGDLEQWETLTRQPFHRDRPDAAVLRRFMGTTSGRKVRYAGLLVEAAVELDCVPPPLAALLSDATGA
jgi:hypothetical protein